MSTPTTLQVNADRVRLNGVGHLTNAIGNGKSDISRKTAEALNTLGQNDAKIVNAIEALTVIIPTAASTDGIISY